MIRFVINLDRSVDRWERVSQIFQDLNLEIRRISAVDGRKVSNEKLQALRPKFKDRHFWLKEMTATEIACYLSHAKAWKAFLDTDEPWALIMEDDISMRENVLDFIKNDSWIPQEVGLIQLTAKEPSGPDWCEKTFISLTNKKASLWKAIRWNSLGAVAYLIDRKTAQKCLDLSEMVIGPVDDILFLNFSPLRKYSSAWALAPAVFYFDDTNESDIGGDKKNNKTPMMKSPIAYLERKWIMMKNKLRAKIFGVKVVR